jgi:uncharacterized protein (TIRG00374 family)
MTDYCKDTDGQNASLLSSRDPQAAGPCEDRSPVASCDCGGQGSVCPVLPGAQIAKVLPEVGLHKPKTKKERRRKVLFAVAFLLFNIIAIGVVLLLELRNERSSFAGAAALVNVLGKNMVFFFIAFLAYAVHVMCDALAYFVLIKECGYGNRLGLSIRVAILGKYYDNITPWNTGGQPFQMAYMVRANIDTPTACSLPIVKYAIRIFFVDFVLLMLMIFVRTDVSALVIVFACVGVFVNTGLPLLLILFSRNVPFLLGVTKKLVGFLHKIKLVKNYDKAVAKAQDTVDSFLAAFKYLGKHKKLILIIGILSVIDCVSVGLLPYFVIRSLGGDVDFFKTLAQTFLVTLASGVMPTPGASGASEGTFYSVFSQSVPEGYLFWAVLLWRMLIFYLPLVLGVVVLIIEWIKGKTQVMLVEKEISWLHTKTINKKSGDAGRQEG